MAVVPATFEGNTFWVGDPHAHTGWSGDGSAYNPEACPDCGRFSDVFTEARAAGLSWVALADHVNGYPAATPEGWEALRDAVLGASASDFLTVPAAEVWFKVPSGDLGHKTLLLFGEDSTLAGLSLASVQPTGTDEMYVDACADIWTWAERLSNAAGPLLLVPHHPSAIEPMPTDWSCADATWQPVTEVYSEHGSALDDGFDPPWAGTMPRGTVPTALDPDGLALRFGFIAGTDSHDTLPGEVCEPDLVRTDQPYGGGLTVIVAPDGTALTRGALLDALTRRSVYATSGPTVPLDVRWSAGGADLGGLGESFTRPTVDLELTVRVPAAHADDVLGVEVIGPRARRPATDAGGGVWSLSVPAADVPAYLYVAVSLDGSRLAPEGCPDGGADRTEWLWTSPSWFD